MISHNGLDWPNLAKSQLKEELFLLTSVRGVTELCSMAVQYSLAIWLSIYLKYAHTAQNTLIRSENPVSNRAQSRHMRCPAARIGDVGTLCTVDGSVWSRVRFICTKHGQWTAILHICVCVMHTQMPSSSSAPHGHRG